MKIWELIKELYADFLLGFLSIFFLVNMILVEIHGSIMVQEPSSFIRWSELIGLPMITLLAIGRFAGDVRAWLAKRKVYNE